jgi:hypothetical protein
MPTTDCHNVQHAITRDTDLQRFVTIHLSVYIAIMFTVDTLLCTVQENNARRRKCFQIKFQ